MPHKAQLLRDQDRNSFDCDKVMTRGHFRLIDMFRAMLAADGQEIRSQLRSRSQAAYEAHARGIYLLKEHLTPTQRTQFDKHGHFEVIGGETKRRYRIRQGWQANVDVLDSKGGFVCALCFMPSSNVPMGDMMLAQKLALELFESEALKVANKLSPLPSVSPPMRPARRTNRGSFI